MLPSDYGRCGPVPRTIKVSRTPGHALFPSLRPFRAIRHRSGSVAGLSRSATLIGGRLPNLRAGVGRIVPIAYIDQNGAAAGFAVDVLNDAARREGFTVGWQRLLGPLEDDLQSQTIDLISAGMATSERKQKFYVSEPWWFEELALLTRAGAEGKPIKRLGMQKVYVEFASAYFNPGTFVFEAAGRAGAADTESEAVCSGELDAALITHGELHDLFLNRPKACEGVHYPIQRHRDLIRAFDHLPKVR